MLASSASFFGAELLSILEHLHIVAKIVHRDVKPENIMLSLGHLKLIDFGSAIPLLLENGDKDDDEGFAGTPEYCSPELLNENSQSATCDIWAFGCVLFHLVSGRGPFGDGLNDYLTFQQIITNEYTWSEGVEETAKSLVDAILKLEPETRLGCHEPSSVCHKEIMAHEFFKDIDWGSLHTADRGRNLNPNPNPNRIPCSKCNSDPFKGGVDLKRNMNVSHLEGELDSISDLNQVALHVSLDEAFERAGSSEEDL